MTWAQQPGQATSGPTRTEKDLLGELQVPANAYYGVQTTELANEATKSGKGILEVICEQHALTEQQIKELLDPVKLTGLDKSKYQ